MDFSVAETANGVLREMNLVGESIFGAQRSLAH